MHLDRRHSLQCIGNVLPGDLEGFIQALPFGHLGDHAAGGDGGAASEGLKLDIGYLFILNLSTKGGRTSRTLSTSASVLNRPKVNSREPCASSCNSPVEISVCEGSRVFDEQADPVAAETPSSLKAKINDSPSIASNLMWALLASLSVGWPLRWLLGIRANIFLISLSRYPARRFTSAVISWRIISPALLIPTMPAMFSVPDRKPRSCPPPMITGFTLIPFLTYKTPMPFGP